MEKYSFKLKPYQHEEYDYSGVDTSSPLFLGDYNFEQNISNHGSNYKYHCRQGRAHSMEILDGVVELMQDHPGKKVFDIVVVEEVDILERYTKEEDKANVLYSYTVHVYCQ